MCFYQWPPAGQLRSWTERSIVLSHSAAVVLVEPPTVHGLKNKIRFTRSMCTNSSFPTATEPVPLCLSDTNRSCASSEASVYRPGSSRRQIGLALFRLPCIRRCPRVFYLINTTISSRLRKATEPKQPRFVTQRGQTRNVIPHRLRNERSMLLAGKMAPRPPLGVGRSSTSIRRP